MSRIIVPFIRAVRALRPGRLVIVVMAALLLLTGVFNIRSVFGDRDGRAWDADPAAPSAAHRLVGAPVRAPSKLDGQIVSLQDTLRDDPDNGAAATTLGQAYMQKALDTGDPSYYPKAEALFANALEIDSTDFAAMVGQGTVALGRHRFADALGWGERARAENPHHAAAYGVIGDAQLELGRYPEAIATFQAMVDLRPDLSSFARVAYARELMGDPTGAIEAMERAATAGASSPEDFAWAQGQLGDMFFDQGDLEEAEHRYLNTLAVFPDYVDGLAGLGRIAAARVLRPGGELVFLANSVLSMLCTPVDATIDIQASERLERPLFGMHRFEWPDDESVEFHLPHGEMIRLLRRSGFEILDLIEIQAPAETDRRLAPFPDGPVSPEWARQWPGEEIWKARNG